MTAKNSTKIQIFTEPPELGHSKRCIWVERRNFYCDGLPSKSRKLKKAGSKQPEPYLILGFDTEYKSPSVATTREEIAAGTAKYRVLSYQFHAKTSEGVEWTGICCPENDDRLSIAQFLIFALGLGVQDHDVKNLPTRIYLVGHFTRADIPAFADFRENKQYVSNVRNTFISTNLALPIRLDMEDGEDFELSVMIRDTMLLTPQSSKSLKGLGELVGQPKITLDDDPVVHRHLIQNMDEVRRDKWDLFKAYAINDATICVKYIERVVDLYRDVTGKTKVPITLTSIGIDILQKFWTDNRMDPVYLVGNETTFERVFDKKGGYFRNQKKDKPIERLFWELDFVTQSYHGGRNEQFWFGPAFRDEWTDWDLSSAYPTAMSLIGYPDWNSIRPLKSIKDVNPTDLIFAYIEFEFPAGVRYPTLPVRTANGLVFPRKGTSYCAAPEIIVAQELGAELKLIKGIVVPTVKDELIFGEFIKHCIDNRIKAGSKTLTGLFWKELSNSTYGKTAQGLREKRVYDMRTSETERLPQSKITNPCFASFITSFVRAVLGEIMNSLPPNKLVFSCTTDGFITNATAEDIALTENGRLARIYKEARKTLTGEPGMLEIKHRVRLPLGWRTRGQATLERVSDLEEMEESATILAKGGIYTKPESETDFEQNDEIVQIFFNRTPETKIRVETMTGIRDIVERDADLVPKEFVKRLSMEFDWKRKPINYQTNEEFGHVSFDTTPWNAVSQFEEIRNLWDEYNRPDPTCIKTLQDYIRFGDFIESRSSMKDHTKWLKKEDPDTNRLRLMLCAAWSQGRAGIIRESLGWSNKKFADVLVSVGLKCNKFDVENGRKRPFVGGSVPPTGKVKSILQLLKKKVPTLDSRALLYDRKRDPDHLSIL